MEDNYQVFASAFIDGLKPPQIYYVWQWADEFRYLSNKSSAEPGKWRTERTPYLKEIMECLSDNVAVNEVVFMKGAQVGGTECGNNWIAYTIDHSPGPMLAVQPSLDLAKRMSKQRISPLVEECESLRKKIGSAKTRESDNTILQKDFPGGTLILAGANSPAGLRSMPAKKLFLDEIDEYPADVGGQGDPVELAMKRANTFGSKKKVFKCSTPTVEGKSRIAEAFEQSDQRYFYVPCPECGHFQTLVFKNLKWPKGEPNKVYYQCESEECGYHIKNWQKTTILKRGEWRAHNANDLNKKIAGFHLNSL